MSVPTGIKAAQRTDSHGHCPQNRLTCANQHAEPCTPKRIQPGRTYAEARQKNHSPAAAITPYGDTGFRKVIPAPVTTMIAAPEAPLLAAEARHRRGQKPRHGPGTIRRHPIPAHRRRMAHRVTCQASTTIATLPAELVTLIGLPCTPEVPGIHLPWTCAATGDPQRPRRLSGTGHRCIRFCRNEYFIRAHIYVRSGILTHAPPCRRSRWGLSSFWWEIRSCRIFTPATTVGRL
jgi:hypothetical protein